MVSSSSFLFVFYPFFSSRMVVIVRIRRLFPTSLLLYKDDVCNFIQILSFYTRSGKVFLPYVYIFSSSASPEFFNGINQSVSLLFRRHNPNLRRPWLMDGGMGNSHSGLLLNIKNKKSWSCHEKVRVPFSFGFDILWVNYLLPTSVVKERFSVLNHIPLPDCINRTSHPR